MSTYTTITITITTTEGNMLSVDKANIQTHEFQEILQRTRKYIVL